MLTFVVYADCSMFGWLFGDLVGVYCVIAFVSGCLYLGGFWVVFAGARAGLLWLDCLLV